MALDSRVKKCVLEAIGAFLESGDHQAVVVEFTTKKDGESSGRYQVVKDGCAHFLLDGYEENGLKSFVKKPARGNPRHGYVLFETARLGDALGRIEGDLENILSDLGRKLIQS